MMFGGDLDITAAADVPSAAGAPEVRCVRERFKKASRIARVRAPRPSGKQMIGVRAVCTLARGRALTYAVPQGQLLGPCRSCLIAGGGITNS